MAANNDPTVKELEAKIQVLDAKRTGKQELRSFLQQEIQNPLPNDEKITKIITLSDEIADITSSIEALALSKVARMNELGGN